MKDEIEQSCQRLLEVIKQAMAERERSMKLCDEVIRDAVAALTQLKLAQVSAN